jgi:hypothetical protein
MNRWGHLFPSFVGRVTPMIDVGFPSTSLWSCWATVSSLTWVSSHTQPVLVPHLDQCSRVSKSLWLLICHSHSDVHMAPIYTIPSPTRVSLKLPTFQLLYYAIILFPFQASFVLNWTLFLKYWIMFVWAFPTLPSFHLNLLDVMSPTS